MLLKVQGVRDYFGIPKVIQHPPEAQEKAKGVMGYFKESTYILDCFLLYKHQNYSIHPSCECGCGCVCVCVCVGVGVCMCGGGE